MGSMLLNKLGHIQSAHVGLEQMNVKQTMAYNVDNVKQSFPTNVKQSGDSDSTEEVD